MGVEHFHNLWLEYEDDKPLVKEVVNVVCHEEDHRAIYYATKSVEATLSFDLLFTGFFDSERNREWFRLGGEPDILGKPLNWESLKERQEYIMKKTFEKSRQKKRERLE